MKRYRLREQMNGIPEPPGKVWFWELEAGGDRRGPLHRVRDVCRRVPVELHRRPRGHRLARIGQDVHGLLAVLGLLPTRGVALRSAVAALDLSAEGDEDAAGAGRPGPLRLVGHLLEDQRAAARRKASAPSWRPTR